MRNNIYIKNKYNTQKDTKYMFILASILFSGAALYSESNNIYYMIIILGITCYTFLNGLLRPSKINKVANNRFTWWVTVVFVFYIIYGTIIPTYATFNVDYAVFIWIVVMNVIFWFIDMDIDRAMDIMIKSCTIASVLLCAFIFVNEYDAILSGSNRIGDSASGNVNTVGLYLGAFSVFTSFKIIFGDKRFKGKKKYILVYLIQVLFMLFTGSKKTLVFIFLGTAIMYILKVRFKLHKYIIPIICGLILVFFMLNNETLYDLIGHRIIDFLGQIGFDVQGASYSQSTETRINMMRIGWEAFLNSPIWGNGWFYFSHYSGLGTYAHNNYIEMLVTYGLLGIFLYYGMYIYILYKLVKKIRINNYAILCISSIIIILINDMASITFYEAPRNYIILFFAYILLSKLKEKKNERINYINR